MRQVSFAAVASAIALLSACDKTPEPKAQSAPPPPAAAAADKPAAAPAAPSEIAYDAPSAWQSVPNPNAMRKATYRIPKAEGDAEDAEMSVSQAGGSVAANIDRWTRQFEKTAQDTTKREDRMVGELKVTVVEVHGTFAGGGMPGSPSEAKPGWAMLGAIVETTPAATFFKLTGPEKTVVAAKADFDKLVSSFHPK